MSLVKLQLELHFLCLGNIPTKIDRVLVCDRWCMYRWGNTTSRNAAVTGSSRCRSNPPGLFLSISVIGRNKKSKPKRLFIRNRKCRKAYTARYQTGRPKDFWFLKYFCKRKKKKPASYASKIVLKMINMGIFKIIERSCLKMLTLDV